MSQSTATQPPGRKARPLSPHLSVYKPTITMTMSIVHRITGGALYFGTVLVVWWLIAAAIGPGYFDFVSWIFGSWIGRIVLFAYTWVLLHHLAGGIRHLIWDTGAGMEKHTASKIAWATVIASGLLTILVWAFALMSRGAM
ncbi:MAG: succinate dehydrogenase, cytochrome b556 subunit [Rhizobiaceae bacterium]|nr:succinate dehydrogenase, cytochrome b556 subunit [Rhizobiaceae bacterium]